MATKRVNIDIVAKDKTRQALSGVQRNLTSLKNNVFSLKGALVGIGAGAVVKSFVDVGREVESLQTTRGWKDISKERILINLVVLF